MNTRNGVILFVILALVAGGWWLRTHYAGQPLPSIGESEDRTYTETTDLYTITATYPAVQNQAAQERIKAIVEEEVTNFKTESVGLIDEREAARIREQKRPYELTVEYKFHQAGEFVSYDFAIYLDTGGAHPNTFFRTVTFNAKGEEQTLDDLFVEGALYLPRLSEEAYPRVLAELEARSGDPVTLDMEDGVRLGTAPSPEAIQFFYLEGNALHLLFPPYQVAAYAAGSFDIAIPLLELSDILKPEFK